MLKSVLVLLVVFCLFSCKQTDFSKIKIGMKKSEVLNVAGEPKEQKQVFGFDYWAYEQGMVVLSKDTVMEIPNLENLKKALIEVDKGLGKLKDDLKQ